MVINTLNQYVYSFSIPTHSLGPVHTYVLEIWVIIGSDNGLAPNWCQAIIWANDDLLSTDLLGTSLWTEIK